MHLIAYKYLLYLSSIDLLQGLLEMSKHKPTTLRSSCRIIWSKGAAANIGENVATKDKRVVLCYTKVFTHIDIYRLYY